MKSIGKRFLNKTASISVSEIAFIAIMLAPTALTAAFKFWPLFFVFAIFDVIFGIVEFVYAKTTGKTVSQHFWNWSKNNKTKAVIILVSMMLMWIILIVHLGAKIF